MPGGAAAKLLALQQQHLLPTLFGQMIGDARADNPAADDDRARRIRQIAHAALIACRAAYLRRRSASDSG